MPLASWPNTLPTYFEADGFNRELPDNTLFDETLSGRFNSRQVSALTSELIDGGMVHTITQVATFWNFYRVTIKNGSLPFKDLLHPITNANSVWRFRTKPKEDAWGSAGLYRLITLNLIWLPDAPV